MLLLSFPIPSYINGKQTKIEKKTLKTENHFQIFFSVFSQSHRIRCPKKNMITYIRVCGRMRVMCCEERERKGENEVLNVLGNDILNVICAVLFVR